MYWQQVKVMHSLREWGYSGIIVSKSGIFIVLNLCVKTLNCSHFEEYMFLFRGLEGRIEVGSSCQSIGTKSFRCLDLWKRSSTKKKAKNGG